MPTAAPPPGPPPLSWDPPPAPRPGSGPRAAPWLWAALPCALLAAAVLALVALGWGPPAELDRRVARSLHGVALRHPAWTQANAVLSDRVWDPWTMRLLTAVALVWLWVRAHRFLAVWCAATVVGGALLQQGLKALLGRPRPHFAHPVDTAPYASMPSGHAMSAAVTCVLLVWLVWRFAARRRLRAGAVAVATVSVVGVSFTRLALGVHWLTDTVAGALLGAALAATAIGTWNALRTRGT